MSAGESPAKPPSTLGQLWLLLKNVRAAVALAARYERSLTVQYIIACLVDALLPVMIVYAGKQIVDAVVAALLLPVPRDPTPTLRWVAVECALLIARSASGQSIGYLAQLLRARLAMHVDLAIFDKAQRLGLRHFEDPKFMDLLERARKDASWRPLEMITHGFSLLRNAVTLTGYAVLLAQFSLWTIPALFLGALPFLAETRFGAEQFSIKQARTQDERQAGYLQQLLTSDYYVKEVKLFALAPLVMVRYQHYAERFFAQDRAFAARRGLAVTGLGALSSLVFYGVYAWVVLRTIQGWVSLGSMTLYLAVFRQGQDALRSMMTSISRAYEDNLYMANFFRFLAWEEDDVAERGPADVRLDENAAPPSVRFTGVSFQYPGSERVALEKVDLELAPGETIALVGANGAGKTTLVKLLTGLYAPTEGRIEIDGKDIATMDRGELRARIGVVFQDFVHYHFTAAENVGIGWLPSMSDRAAVEQAAEQGGAAEVLQGLPKGMDTMLGRWFGGEQLSGGQWQRVALARAFMRKSKILILDEPTAAIDAEGEHELFDRFRQLKAGRTAVLITHRFGSVRMADRIVVLEHGHIAEIGTHQELLARDGIYAKMFRMQAEGYVEPKE